MVHSTTFTPTYFPKGKPHKFKKYSQFKAYSECLLPSNATKIFLVSDMICLPAKRYNQSKVSLTLSRKYAVPLSRWSNTVLQQDSTIVNTRRILIGCRFFDQSTLLIYFSANVHCVLLVVDYHEVEFRKYYARTLMNSRIIDL